MNDANAEYPVQVVKHFYKAHIILQYFVSNTIEDQRLSDVKFLNLKAPQVIASLPTADGTDIGYSESAYMYVILQRDEQNPFPTSKVEHSLQMKITEVDVDT